jgi:hypothetical protein
MYRDGQENVDLLAGGASAHAGRSASCDPSRLLGDGAEKDYALLTWFDGGDDQRGDSDNCRGAGCEGVNCGYLPIRLPQDCSSELLPGRAINQKLGILPSVTLQVAAAEEPGRVVAAPLEVAGYVVSLTI